MYKMLTKNSNYPQFIVLSADEFKLYSLIYARALASLMAPSRFDATSVVLENNNYYFNASGSVLKFDGYLRFI